MKHPKNGSKSGKRGSSRPVQPTTQSLKALNAFSSQIANPDLRATFYGGFLRSLSNDTDNYLWDKPLTKPVQFHAAEFLATPTMSDMLGVSAQELSDAKVTRLPWVGHRVRFAQELTTKEGIKVPVLRGFIEVVVAEDGKVLTLNSTARHGKNADTVSLKDVRPEADAIAAATKFLKSKRKFDNIEMSKARLVLSEHRKRFSPIYQVIVTAQNPRRSYEVLVKANTLEIVHDRNLVKHIVTSGKKLPRSLRAIRRSYAENSPTPASTPNKDDASESDAVKLDTAGNGTFGASKGKGKGKQTSGQTQVKANALLRIPDPNVSISKQVSKVLLESLIAPDKLANANYTCHVGNKRNPVAALKDGTFNYVPNDPEFSAVATMFALTIHIDLMRKWGMPDPGQQAKLYVEDNSIQDNAQFDQVTVEIRIGVGTGVRNNGLSRYVAYDIGVSLHENGHYIVYITAPGKDLPGPEGAAIHEAVGDMMTLLVDWWFRSKFSKSLGTTITVADIVASARIIGAYAAPPTGIRNQKNTKKPPISGEPHDDSEIVGGAMADFMVELVQTHGIDPGLEMFGRMLIAALSLLPSHKVTFRDMLNGLLTADKQLNQGANRQSIIQNFANHGITLGSGGKKRGSPVIIVVN